MAEPILDNELTIDAAISERDEQSLRQFVQLEGGNIRIELPAEAVNPAGPSQPRRSKILKHDSDEDM
jgi:hypothetical protein